MLEMRPSSRQMCSVSCHLRICIWWRYCHCSSVSSFFLSGHFRLLSCLTCPLSCSHWSPDRHLSARRRLIPSLVPGCVWSRQVVCQASLQFPVRGLTAFCLWWFAAWLSICLLCWREPVADYEPMVCLLVPVPSLAVRCCVVQVHRSLFLLWFYLFFTFSKATPPSSGSPPVSCKKYVPTPESSNARSATTKSTTW